MTGRPFRSFRLWMAIPMILSDFNLIVTTSRGYENDACSEIWFLLGEIGDKQPTTEKSGISGLVVAKTSLDPFKVIGDLRKILKEQPWEFRYTLRIIPVEVIVQTSLSGMKKASQKLSSRISEEETFRVTVEKRHTRLTTREIIEAAAEDINRKVDLHNPAKILLIEVLGGLTGVSIIKPEDILSVTKERAGQPHPQPT